MKVRCHNEINVQKCWIERKLVSLRPLAVTMDPSLVGVGHRLAEKVDLPPPAMD